jgi:hypothetical protein
MKLTKIFLTLVLTAALPAAAGELRAIVPVVGSTHGAFNSYFRTELQMNNRSAQPMRGTLVFHPLGGGASRSTTYELASHATLYWPDFMESIEATGLGSLDVVVEGKGMPVIVARAFDDRGDDGTSGATVPAVHTEDALHVGASATLILPSDRRNFRFNVGVRALADGAAATVAIYGENGILRKDLGERSWSGDAFEQLPADAFAGETLLASESLVFTLIRGGLVIYGTTTDNTTNDPSINIAQ